MTSISTHICILDHDLIKRDVICDVSVQEIDSESSFDAHDVRYSPFQKRKLFSFIIPYTTWNICQTVILIGPRYFYVASGEYGPTSHIFISRYEGFYISRDEANIINVFN